MIRAVTLGESWPRLLRLDENQVRREQGQEDDDETVPELAFDEFRIVLPPVIRSQDMPSPA